jgi:hypothetical protein
VPLDKTQIVSFVDMPSSTLVELKLLSTAYVSAHCKPPGVIAKLVIMHPSSVACSWLMTPVDITSVYFPVLKLELNLDDGNCESSARWRVLEGGAGLLRVKVIGDTKESKRLNDDDDVVVAERERGAL